MRRKVFKLLVVFIFVILVGFMIMKYTTNKNTAGDTVTSVFTAINNGDSSASFNMFSERQRNNISEDAWKNVVNDVKGTYNLTSLEIISDEEIENTGNVYLPEEKARKITISIDTAKETYVTFMVLILDKDKNWKIDEMTSSKKK